LATLARLSFLFPDLFMAWWMLLATTTYVLPRLGTSSELKERCNHRPFFFLLARESLESNQSFTPRSLQFFLFVLLAGRCVCRN
jgi:hypothetical protein